MSHHDRLFAAMRGEDAGILPWAPRMDLWQISLQARGNLPQEFAGLSTAGIADALGVACHAVRADYTQARNPADLLLRGFGIDNHPDYPFRVEMRDLDANLDTGAEHVRYVIHTTEGDVQTHLELSQAMKAEDISLPCVRRYLIESVDDLDTVARVFDNCEVVPTPAAYGAFHQRVGDRGVAVASGPIAASSMHLVLHELAAMDRFYYLFADSPDRLLDLTVRIEPLYEACLDAVVQCDAEVVFWGANYDRDLTWPPFFEAHIAPWLTHVAERLHAAGKLLLTHADGENDQLMHFFAACGVDVVESVCPAPMTKLSLAELRHGFGPQVTVWGGVPSVALLPGSMSDAEFEPYLDRLFAEVADQDRLILEHRCNPYAGLLDRALHTHDFHLEPGDYAFSRSWLEAQRPAHDVLHFNWLHAFYRRDDLASTLAAYHDFAENLHVARQLGYRIIWTLHNLYPHERPFPQVDHLARLLLADHADVVLAHCAHAADMARKRFHCQDVRAIPHGNFIDVFRNDLSRAEARSQLDLGADAFVYLFFGNARAYKSIEALIDAFDPDYGQQLTARAGGGVRVWRSEYFPAEEFQLYLNSDDVVVLPFSEVLTSGTAITALIFGRPLIVPDLGCLPELVDDTIGITYDPAAADALPLAMDQIRRRDLIAAGAAARARAEALDWDGIAASVVAAYQGGDTARRSS